METGIGNRKLYCIVNPGSGGGNTANIWWNNIMPVLDAKGYDYFWEETEPGQIQQQVRRAITEKNAAAIAVVGGDGSLYEAVNGMVENDALIKENLVMAALPAGSARDFIRFLYKDQPSGILSLFDKGIIKNIDLGKCILHNADQEDQVRYFINSFDAGAGADTCAAINANEGKAKRVFKNGKTAFMLTALKVLMSFKYTQTRVELPGETFEGEYIIIGFANGQYAGGGMQLFPKAALDDGLLDLLLVPKKGRREILLTFSKLYNGSFLGIEDIVYRQATTAKIITERPILVELDGEIPGSTDVEIQVVPKALPLLMFP